jgi:hypothetical protein
VAHARQARGKYGCCRRASGWGSPQHTIGMPCQGHAGLRARPCIREGNSEAGFVGCVGSSQADSHVGRLAVACDLASGHLNSFSEEVRRLVSSELAPLMLKVGKSMDVLRKSTAQGVHRYPGRGRSRRTQHPHEAREGVLRATIPHGSRRRRSWRIWRART